MYRAPVCTTAGKNLSGYVKRVQGYEWKYYSGNHTQRWTGIILGYSLKVLLNHILYTCWRFPPFFLKVFSHGWSNRLESSLRLVYTWEVFAWKIAQLVSCQLEGKYPWEVAVLEKAFEKLPNIYF